MTLQPELAEIEPKDTELQTVEFDKKELVQHVAKSFTSFTMLSVNQKAVLTCLLDDFMSSKFRTDGQIATDCGLHRKSVYNIKRSPGLLQAICEVMPEITKIKLPEVMANAVALSKKTYKAAEFVARFSGAYVPKSQQLNINANLQRRAQNVSPEQAIDAFLGKLMSLGWSADRIYERAKELQANLP